MDGLSTFIAISYLVAASFFILGLKYMSSPEKCKQFMERKGALLAVKDFDTTNAPEYLKIPLNRVNNSRYIWNTDHESWYPSLATEANSAFVDLYNEVITPQEFVNRMDKASQEVRNNPDIRKFKVE